MDVTKPGIVVDGQWRCDDGWSTLDVTDPATGKVVGALVRGGQDHVNLAVESARRCFDSDAWRRMPVAERGRLLMKLAAAMLDRADELARIESADVGKPLSQAKGDVRTAARYFEYYAGMADKIQGSTIPVRWGVLDFTLREPHGVCAQIVPWNYPLAMAARGVAPALAAGNCVVVKPAEDASLSLLRLGRLAIEVGFPAGALNVVSGYGAEAGAALARHPGVDHITFTGSVPTGTEIMKMAAEGVRPVALELGGKSPNIVLADADMDLAAGMALRGIILNAGQTCNSCPRLLVHRDAHVALLQQLRARFDALRLGRPEDDLDMGPVVSLRQKRRIESYVDLAREQGAAVTEHGIAPTDRELREGFFVRPAILDGVMPDHRVFREEIFGPVLAVTVFDDIDEAVELANASEYGLNAGVFTKDVSHALQLAHRLRVGQVYINGYGSGGSVEVPFGGFKKSGIGREKGIDGFLNYTQTKSVSAHFAQG